MEASKKPKSVQLKLTIKPEHFAQIQQYADTYHYTVAEVIRAAYRQFILKPRKKELHQL